jgi:penicillin-binding protein 1C
MLKLFREAGMPRRVPPALPDCVSQQTGESPVISSPLRNVSYSLHRKSSEEVIHLEAAVAADVRSVFWFDGRSLIGNVPVSGGSMPWRPATDGIHLIRIVDDHGRAPNRKYQYSFYREGNGEFVNVQCSILICHLLKSCSRSSNDI